MTMQYLQVRVASVLSHIPMRHPSRLSQSRLALWRGRLGYSLRLREQGIRSVHPPTCLLAPTERECVVSLRMERYTVGVFAHCDHRKPPLTSGEAHLVEQQVRVQRGLFGELRPTRGVDITPGQTGRRQAPKGDLLSSNAMVGRTGIEPVTLGLRVCQEVQVRLRERISLCRRSLAQVPTSP